MFVVSAPSGAGKSTLCQALVERHPHVRLSVSCTTRPPRANEQNGRDYHFLSDAEFRERAGRGEFLEWAEVHGNRYGTLKSTVAEALRGGHDVILNIDPQGARNVRDAFPTSVLVFVCPPSWAVLESRLRARGQDSPDVIARRLANARLELAQAHLYDYLVVNEDLNRAIDDLSAVWRAEHQRTNRRGAVLNDLISEDSASR